MLPNYRREALHTWKNKVGSSGTYQKLSEIFECAGYKNYADSVRRSIQDSKIETSDNERSLLSVSQPETYPVFKSANLPQPSIELSETSHCEQVLLVKSADETKNLPEGEDLYNNVIIATIGS